MTIFSVRNLTIAAAIAAGFLAGCTPSPKVEEKKPEEIVSARAAERWQELMQLDFEGAYAYLAPSVKTVLSADGFKRRYSLDPRQTKAPWTKAEVRSIVCTDNESCNVQVYVESVPNIPQFKGMVTSATIDERWIQQDGQWWLYIK